MHVCMYAGVYAIPVMESTRHHHNHHPHHRHQLSRTRLWPFPSRRPEEDQDREIVELIRSKLVRALRSDCTQAKIYTKPPSPPWRHYSPKLGRADQTASPLLMWLPAELRNQIYLYILEGPFVLGAYFSGDVNPWSPCPSSSSPPPLYLLSSSLSSSSSPNSRWSGDRRVYRRRTTSSLGQCGKHIHILSTCQQVYSEASGLLYTNNSFEFRRINDLLVFGSAIAPCRLAGISTLLLSWVDSESWFYKDITGVYGNRWTPANARASIPLWWTPTWEHVAEHMPGLRAVELHIHFGPGQATPADQEELLQPMMALRGLRSLKLVMLETPDTSKFPPLPKIKVDLSPFAQELVSTVTRPREPVVHVVNHKNNVSKSRKSWLMGR